MPENVAPIRIASIGSAALATCLALVPALFFVTNQSLWADEAASAWFATHAHGLNPAQFPGMLGALSQMPGYHILLLAWVHLAGDSERALRALNIPFAALFLGSLFSLCRHRAGRLWWLPAAPFAFCPLFTSYVNEARPYVAILAFSTAATVALLLHLRSRSRLQLWLCAVFCLAAFSFHLTGFLTPLVLLCFVLLIPERVQVLRDLRFPALATLPGYIALLWYYARLHGAGVSHHLGRILQSEIPGNVTASWRNCVFVLYEALGFAGLGPPRNDLRIHAGLHSFHGYGLPLFFGIAAVAPLLVLLWRDRSTASSLLISAAFGLLVLFLIARMEHFGFVGRHCMALIGPFACSIVLLLSERARTTRTAAVLLTAAVFLTAAWIISSARLLFLYPYSKDDPRAALAKAENAAAAQHLSILWNAGEEEAVYYDAFDPRRTDDPLFSTPLSLSSSHGLHLIPIQVLPPNGAAVAPGDYILVRGKPDISDPKGLWESLCAGSSAQLLARYNGFAVYRVRVQALQRTVYSHGE